MSNFRSKAKQQQVQEEEQQPDEQPTIEAANESDSTDSDDSFVNPTIELLLDSKNDPNASLFEKLFNLQHSFTFTKDTAVSAGRMNYTFTSLPYWWQLVSKFFQRNKLYPYWETMPFDSNHCVLVSVIRDIPSGEELRSKWIIPLTDKETIDKDGGHTHTSDMLKDGSYTSYWQRRGIFMLCGIITGEDTEAELSAAEGEERRSRKAASTTTATTLNNLEKW